VLDSGLMSACDTKGQRTGRQCSARLAACGLQCDEHHAPVAHVHDVCCVVLALLLCVAQWCSEASKKLNGSLKMYPYHGQNR
jgi:hypothetical protein